MPRPFVYDVSSLAGGLNLTAAEMIGDSEAVQLDNFYVKGPSLFQREGYTEIAGPHTEEILSVALYDPDPTISNDELIILGCRSSLAKVSGANIVLLTVADGRVYPDSENRWWFVQYNDELFGCQKGNGGVKRIYGSAVIEAGIVAPATEVTPGDGGAGKKLAGVYRFAVRYYNRTTGARSNWSPLSKPLTIIDNQQVLLTNVPVSSNPQVNARQIGATAPDGAIIYLVGQIDDNVTTTYLENALSPDEYGEADVDVNGNPTTDTRNGPPPDQAWALEKHKERLFVLNKDGLFWSEPAYFQSFKATSYFPLVRGTGLLAWDQHGLVIATEKDAQILLGDTPSDWRIDLLSREHGCPAGKSMAIGDGTLFWYTGTNIVASSGGAPAILPGIERIREFLDDISDADKADVIGETIPSRGWYVLSADTSTGRVAIIYDYKENRFAGVIPDAPKTIVRLLSEQAKVDRVYAAFDDVYDLYDFLTDTTDDGTAITANLKTKNFGYETQGMSKITRRVNILCPRTNGTVTLRVYHDGTLVTTRSGLSVNSNGWKRFGVNTSGQPGALVQIGLEYSGTTQLRIDQLQIEGVLIQGRRPIPA